MLKTFLHSAMEKMQKENIRVGSLVVCVIYDGTTKSFGVWQVTCEVRTGSVWDVANLAEIRTFLKNFKKERPHA